jgi:hypothetical protein
MRAFFFVFFCCTLKTYVLPLYTFFARPKLIAILYTLVIVSSHRDVPIQALISKYSTSPDPKPLALALALILHTTHHYVSPILGGGKV